MRLLPALAVSLAATAAVADRPAGNVPAPTSGAAPIVAAPATPPVLTNYFRSDANAAAMVDGAVAEAKAGGRRAILVFGADWCSDSVALAAVLSSDFFQAYLGSKYSVTFIDVNRPTRGQGRNQEIVRQFGIETMTGTPEVVVIGRTGRPLNTLADAQSWRNAGERPVLHIMGYFRDLPED